MNKTRQANLSTTLIKFAILSTSQFYISQIVLRHLTGITFSILATIAAICGELASERMPGNNNWEIAH